METVLVQARVDKELKEYTSQLFEDLGIDMPTAFRIFLKKCKDVSGLPFEMKKQQTEMEKILEKAEAHARRKGIQDMSLDEINEEIRLYRMGK